MKFWQTNFDAFLHCCHLSLHERVAYAERAGDDHNEGRGQEVVGGHPHEVELEAAQEYCTETLPVNFSVTIDGFYYE